MIVCVGEVESNSFEVYYKLIVSSIASVGEVERNSFEVYYMYIVSSIASVGDVESNSFEVYYMYIVSSIASVGDVTTKVSTCMFASLQPYALLRQDIDRLRRGGGCLRTSWQKLKQAVSHPSCVDWLRP